MKKLLLLLCTVGLFAFAGSGTAMAGSPCPPSSPNAGGDPACGVDHNQPPPACDNPNAQPHNPNCPPPEPPPPACDTSGPISSIVQQISDGIRNGGGAPLADVIDEINCQLIVGVLGL